MVLYWLSLRHVVSTPPVDAHLAGCWRQKQSENLLFSSETLHQMSEGSTHQQLRGGLRDVYKIGSAIFWKMCCWFDTFQVRALFLRTSIIVDEDKLPALPSKRKEELEKEEKRKKKSSQGRSLSPSFTFRGFPYTVNTTLVHNRIRAKSTEGFSEGNARHFQDQHVFDLPPHI